MLDTIDLLETIGQNAALRYASAEELAQALTGTDASDALKLATASGDTAPLAEALGQTRMHVTHHSQAPGHEEQDEEKEEKEQKSPDRNKPSHG